MKLKDIDESVLAGQTLSRTPVYCLGVKLGRGSSLGKIVATDFTTVSELISVINPSSMEDLLIGANLVMEFDISTKVLEEIANEYLQRTGNHLFDMGRPNDNDNTFYLLKEKFCLLDLLVHYSRRSLTKITALAKQSPIIYSGYSVREDIEDLINGILKLPSAFLKAHFESLLKVLPNQFGQALQAALKGSENLSNSSLELQPRQVAIKTESRELTDTLFRDDSITTSMNSNLNNVHIQSSLPYDDDTQISSSSKPSLNSLVDEDSQRRSQSLKQEHGSIREIEISQLTQVSQITEPDYQDTQIFPLSESSKESDGSTVYSLSYLNENFSEFDSNRFYKTKGYVVGCIPEEFELLCAKGYDYNIIKGDYALTDPKLKPLEIIITDINPSSEGDHILDETNSITLTIEDDDLLDFFKVRSIESLYINISKLSELFYSRNGTKLTAFTLYKKPVKWGSILSYVWAAHNLTIDDLV